jgi:hypothetical protein
MLSHAEQYSNCRFGVALVGAAQGPAGYVAGSLPALVEPWVMGGKWMPPLQHVT